MLRALGGCRQTLNFFIMMKSSITEEALLDVRFPAIEVLEVMRDIKLYQLETLLSNISGHPNCVEDID